MRATLFGVPGSHPAMAAELMLRYKRISYRRIDLVTALHRGVLRALGFSSMTVPAIRLDGQRLQGTRTIARSLDALRPEPPLFPRDPDRRAAVEHAEAWGDEVLQPVARRIGWATLKRDPSAVRSFLDEAHLGVPVELAVRTAPPIIRLSARLNQASDEAVRADLGALPALLDRVDELIAEGVIGGEQHNAADFQLLTSIRLLMAFDDLQPLLKTRPATRAALAVVPRFPGRVPPALPEEWLAPLRQTTTAA